MANQDFSSKIDRAVDSVTKELSLPYSRGLVSRQEIRAAISPHFGGIVPDEVLEAVLIRMPTVEGKKISFNKPHMEKRLGAKYM